MDKILNPDLGRADAELLGDAIAMENEQFEPVNEPEAAPDNSSGINSIEVVEPFNRDELRGPVAALVAMLGGIICLRANVAELKPPEIMGITDSALNVLELYPVNVSPKVAAWAGLSISILAVVQPRVKEAREKQIDDTPETPETPDAPDAGEMPESIYKDDLSEEFIKSA